MESRGGSLHQYDLTQLQIISLQYSIKAIESMTGREAASMIWMLHANKAILNKLKKGESYYVENKGKEQSI